MSLLNVGDNKSIHDFVAFASANNLYNSWIQRK